jgi:adenylate cyclase
MRTRIGLNTGLAVIGNMGSRRRFNYTMMGDTVNLAARTESGAKAYGVDTMVTGETRSLALAHGDGLRFRYLDKIVVKGRRQPVEMHELVGFEADLDASVREGLEQYEAAVRLYLDRDFERAAKAFGIAARLERSPGVNPSLVLAERCVAFLAHPPGPDWSGEHVMKEK